MADRHNSIRRKRRVDEQSGVELREGRVESGEWREYRGEGREKGVECRGTQLSGEREEWRVTYRWYETLYIGE